jgi:hypothetical protein
MPGAELSKVLQNSTRCLTFQNKLAFYNGPGVYRRDQRRTSTSQHQNDNYLSKQFHDLSALVIDG